MVSVGKRNLEFLLYEVFDVLSLTHHKYYEDNDREMFDMVLRTSLDIAQELFLPILKEMDENPPRLVGGKVKVHPAVRTIMKEMGQGGWIGATYPKELGGSQLPLMIDTACTFVFSAANYSASVFPLLSKGAAGLIIAYGDQDLIATYVPRLLSGEWQGTMALTEPQAGSSLSDIATMAEPTPKGYYKLQGRKVFISAADHDGVENVVHLMLAKIEGAPVGVKGISLFVVPQKRIDDDGSLVPNDVSTTEIYHKLGYRGSPIVGLSLGEADDCRGYLVGKPHEGLRYMFQMMNESRLGVGAGAAAIASSAYYAALEYAKERLQGRPLTNKNPALPQVPIIQHADVKRMLLFQRAIVEGSLSLLMQCSQYADLAKVLGGKEKEKYRSLLDILIPVAKSYPSEMGVLSVSQSLQCFGGYGYCDDFSVEQHYRDMRIHPIHEGTTGIQALDLLGRKVVIHDGLAFGLYLAQMGEAIEAAQEIGELKRYALQLRDALESLQRATSHLLSLAQSQGPERSMADATLYLEFFGIVTIAWQWLLQGIAAQKALKNGRTAADANFYRGKLCTLRYFFGYELPKTLGLSFTLLNNDGLTVEIDEKTFVE
ncbi:MAG: acyl-CoA dehydrogenase [Desulfobacca sp. RBG_16_60_12]|nr:MAG: acyl-CoA dehydrogenase [Desulfobacca sp. RBG_16_60_12]